MTLDRMEQLENELAEANARRDDLRTALEWANKERDEARQERERLLDREAFLESYSETLQGYQTDLARMLKAVCAERDRLRAQLAAKHSECPDCADYAARSGRFAEQADRLQRERDEARAEVATAYRRGAEAMREACAQRVKGEGNGHYGLTGADVAKTLRALPIPEER